MSSKLESLGNSAFWGCTALTTINLPASLTSIGADVFNGSGLTNATYNWTTATAIPSKENKAYGDRASKVTLLVPAGMKDDYLNKDGDKTNGYDGVTNILEVGGVSSQFTKDGIVYKITQVDNASTTSVVEPNEVMIVDVTDYQQFFYDLPSTVSQTVGDKTVTYNVTAIDKQTFNNCTDATTFVIPENVKTIGSSNFASTVKFVVIPASVTTIDAGAFDGSKARIYTEATTPKGWDIDKTFDITVLSENLQAFKDAGFTNVKPLGDEKSIILKNDVWFEVYNSTDSKLQAIDSKDHSDTSITIASTAINEGFAVDQVAEKAFNGLTSMTSVTLPTTMKKILGYAFYGTKLTSIDLPASVDSIGLGAFAENDKLLKVYVHTNKQIPYATVPSTKELDDTFDNEECVLHVPSATAATAFIGWEGFLKAYIKNDNETPAAPTYNVITVADDKGYTADGTYYSGNSLSDKEPSSITFSDKVTKFGLTDIMADEVTVQKLTTTDKNFALTLSGANTLSEFVNGDGCNTTITNNGVAKLVKIINNGKLTIVNNKTLVSGTTSGEYINYGTFINLDGTIKNVRNNNSYLSVSDGMDVKTRTDGTTYLQVSPTYMSKGDTLIFNWQKLNKTAYKSIKIDTIVSDGTETILDNLDVTTTGDYLCYITDINKEKGVIARTTLAVYGEVEDIQLYDYATLVLKSFQFGIYDINGATAGYDYTKTFEFDKNAAYKDTIYTFKIHPYKGYSVKYAYALVSYSNSVVVDSIPINPADSTFKITHIEAGATTTVNIYHVVETAGETIDKADINVWGKDGVLHLNVPKPVTVYVVTFDGRLQMIKAKAGDQQYRLGSGNFIIRIEDKSWKLHL